MQAARPRSTESQRPPSRRSRAGVHRTRPAQGHRAPPPETARQSIGQVVERPEARRVAEHGSSFPAPRQTGPRLRPPRTCWQNLAAATAGATDAAALEAAVNDWFPFPPPLFLLFFFFFFFFFYFFFFFGPRRRLRADGVSRRRRPAPPGSAGRRLHRRSRHPAPTTRPCAGHGSRRWRWRPSCRKRRARRPARGARRCALAVRGRAAHRAEAGLVAVQAVPPPPPPPRRPSARREAGGGGRRRPQRVRGNGDGGSPLPGLTAADPLRKRDPQLEEVRRQLETHYALTARLSRAHPARVPAVSPAPARRRRRRLAALGLRGALLPRPPRRPRRSASRISWSSTRCAGTTLLGYGPRGGPRRHRGGLRNAPSRKR